MFRISRITATGTIAGRSMCHIRRNRDAPSTIAASCSSGGTLVSAAR